MSCRRTCASCSVGRDSLGRTEREIRAEARAFGVRQDLELHTNLTTDEVSACIRTRASRRSSRVAKVLASPSREPVADSPVAMMEEAHVGSKAYINSQTGILATRETLGRCVRQFLEEVSATARGAGRSATSPARGPPRA